MLPASFTVYCQQTVRRTRDWPREAVQHIDQTRLLGTRQIMDTDNLVKMANQIGDFFETMPDRGEALENIAGHLRRFWAPRMRMTILEHLEATDGHGMREIVVAAITAHRAELWPRG